MHFPVTPHNPPEQLGGPRCHGHQTVKGFRPEFEGLRCASVGETGIKLMHVQIRCVSSLCALEKTTAKQSVKQQLILYWPGKSGERFIEYEVLKYRQ